MITPRTWRKHKSSIIFGGLTLLSLIYSSGDINRSMSAIASLKQEIATQSEQQTKLEQQLAFEEEQAKIAEARYQKGCLPVVATVYPHKYVSITLGKIIKDRITREPLPAGTVVCDANGATGVIDEGGAVGAIAFTGNRDMVAKRLNRFRGGIYSQPIDETR